MAEQEWILAEPVATDTTNYEWSLGQPHVVIEVEAVGGNAGIMTTNTGYWGATY